MEILGCDLNKASRPLLLAHLESSRKLATEVTKDTKRRNQKGKHFELSALVKALCVLGALYGFLS
jgi:hypothetical protein